MLQPALFTHYTRDILHRARLKQSTASAKQPYHLKMSAFQNMGEKNKKIELKP